MILKVSDDLQEISMQYETPIEQQQMNITFMRKIRNWKFKTKGKRWKGDVNFVRGGNRVSASFWKEIKTVCDKHKFPFKSVNVSTLFTEVDRDYVERFCLWLFNNHSEGMTPRSDQIEAVYRAIKNRYAMLDLSTRAGKTIISYMYIMYLRYHKLADRVLYICPDMDLVVQTNAEFIRYADGKFDLKMCMVHGGSRVQDIQPFKIVIGNFQSLGNRDVEFFRGVNCLIYDEAHRATADTYKYITESCGATMYRLGMSGTIIEDSSADYYMLIKYTGPIVMRIKKRELIDNGNAADIKVKIMILNYISNEIRREFSRMKSANIDGEKLFRLEQLTIRLSELRIKWICEVIISLPKNSLIFFIDKKNGYGKRICTTLRNMEKGKEVYYIDGDVDKDLRQIYKERMEEGNNKILVASYSTYSTGKTISNLHYILCAESMKSEVVIGQATGRGMTNGENKEHCIWIDIVDDFSIDEPAYEYVGYGIKHMKERISYYNKENLEYTLQRVNMMDKGSIDVSMTVDRFANIVHEEGIYGK